MSKAVFSNPFTDVEIQPVTVAGETVPTRVMEDALKSISQGAVNIITIAPRFGELKHRDLTIKMLVLAEDGRN
jgi:hypothetical protein